MSGFDIICNSSSLPLTNIDRFDPLRVTISLMVLKRFHIFIRNVSFLSPTDVEPHNLNRSQTFIPPSKKDNLSLRLQPTNVIEAFILGSNDIFHS